MKKFLLSALYIIIPSLLVVGQESLWIGKSVDFNHGKLIVSDNQRFLMHEDGTPFFYLGDTAWELFHRLNKDEVELYLENRRAKGFTVIQAVILAELNGLNTPNRNGDCPLIANDPTQPNKKYFEWVDEVVQMAESKGIYIGLLPTWGDKVDKQWGTGPVIFNEKNAAIYGEFLGKRYKNFPNIIWMNGGDRLGGGDNYKIWDVMGKAIKKEDSNHLMTFHPSGEASSSQWFHDCNWLDFNICQTGHAQVSYEIVRRLIITDYNRVPVKPCMDAEPRYEDIPKYFDVDKGRFDDHDIRKSLYWSLFSGAFGYTYGCNDIWQFYSPEEESVIGARNYWYNSLDKPGSYDLIYARTLLTSYDFFSRVPDQSIIITPQQDDNDMAVATRGNHYAFIYLPNGTPIDVKLDKLFDSDYLKIRWFDPQNGDFTIIKETKAEGTFRAEPAYAGKDWVLILEKIEK
ncbi:glycoside hydrolase family 140 protein [Prevotella sp. 10(H)]|uniref:glycoside hydrolase family 140 protein n=1 Tax=Prevotella sp. 10(H) TaxID=1158294 RepID=UPI0005678C5C|nr:glycoside hydrolase family 140 protein [Prevotella sp. 10(H)]